MEDKMDKQEIIDTLEHGIQVITENAQFYNKEEHFSIAMVIQAARIMEENLRREMQLQELKEKMAFNTVEAKGIQ